LPYDLGIYDRVWIYAKWRKPKGEELYLELEFRLEPRQETYSDQAKEFRDDLMARFGTRMW
jgi:hypothetical protein